ncbi:hypothetical protein ACFX19_021842 [Malus domestica]
MALYDDHPTTVLLLSYAKIVQNLSLGVKLNDASKKLGKTFATGASIVKRTSAKDVKAALIDRNWDIEAAQKELRRREKVLASKKSSRMAVEGLLALAQN